MILISNRARVFFFCFVLIIFSLFRRFPQVRSLRGHWECRSNSKSVGVPLIWTLEDWTTTPITQALLWIPPPLLPSHLLFHPTSPPLTLPKPHPHIFIIVIIIISSGCTYHHGYLPIIALSGPITIVLLCKLFLDVDRAIKCYTKKYSCMVIQNCIL